MLRIWMTSRQRFREERAPPLRNSPDHRVIGAVYDSLFNFQIVFLVEIATSAALPPPRNDNHLPLLADLGQALEREQEADDCRQRTAGEHHQPVDLVNNRRLGTDDRERSLCEGL